MIEKPTEDQIVFTFINSDRCINFYSLQLFCINNNFPFRERWAFYLRGKLNLIDESIISSMSWKGHLFYGGHIDGEVFHWDNYLYEERERKNNIKRELELDNKTPTADEINLLFIKRGWEYVKERLSNDHYNEVSPMNND